MTKKSLKAEVHSAVKGFITEASPLNFPEGASLDEENFELSSKGVRKRRLGMDYEENYLKRLAGVNPNNISFSKVSNGVWKDVGGVSGKNYVVIRFESQLSFFDMSYEDLGDSGYVGSVTIEMTGATDFLSFTSVNGFLVVANGRQQVAIVNKDLSVEYANLLSRDLWGVATGDASVDNAPYARPDETIAINWKHRYNLYNQGWGVPRRGEAQAENESVDVVEYFKVARGKLPSNVESVWTAITTKGSNPSYECLRANAWEESFGTLPPSAKGYFIIDPLYRGNGRNVAVGANHTRHPVTLLTNTSGFPNDITPGGPTVVTEFAGRVFYAGFSGEVIDGDERSPSLMNHIFFSQLVKSKQDIVKCYQEGDPTSRESNDVVDTDGGFVPISGAQAIVGLIPTQNSLVILAKNGIWMLSGGNDYGFSATNYRVDKISDFGCVSPNSVVYANGSVLYWGDYGIYQVARDQYGTYQVSSITDKTIKTFYLNLSPEAKENVSGVFDSEGNTIRWLITDSLAFDSEDHIELILDYNIPAFYKYRIRNHPNTKLGGLFAVSPVQVETVVETVTVEGEVVKAATVDVEIPYQQRKPSPTSIRYIILTREDAGTTVKYGFGFYKNPDFLDWVAIDEEGIDAKAFLLTGGVTGGDSGVDKQTPYITVHMERTETTLDEDGVPLNQSSCKMRSVWEWAVGAVSNKWSPLYQVYRYTRGFIAAPLTEFDTGFSVISTKNKLRGRGRAVSVYFETEPGKDCRIIGWNLNINGNSIT